MDPTPSTQGEDSTERVADITETWESSPITEPDAAADPQAKAPVAPGFAEDDSSVLHGERPAEGE